MEDNFHVSLKPITKLRTKGLITKVEISTGKPGGLWYAKGTAWLPIMNRDLGAPVSNAVRMELGIVEAINAAAADTMVSILPENLYVYKLQLEGKHYTDSIAEPTKNKVLRLSSANLIAFVNGFYEPWKVPERVIENIVTYFSKAALGGVEVSLLFDKYFETVEIPEEEWYDEYQSQDEEEKEDYVQQNIDEILEWLEDSLQLNYPAKANEIFAIADDMQDFIEKQLWATFWNTRFSERFAGVEFDTSVVNAPGAPVWSKYLDIPSGCLIRPTALRVPLRLVAKLSLNTGNIDTNIAVYGKVRNTTTVKRVRKKSA